VSRYFLILAYCVLGAYLKIRTYFKDSRVMLWPVILCSKKRSFITRENSTDEVNVSSGKSLASSKNITFDRNKQKTILRFFAIGECKMNK
jgi:hypothetical protein